MPSNRASIRRFEEQNQQSAYIALNDPQKYPGVMQEWAEMVLQKTPQKLNKHALQIGSPDTRHAHQMSFEVESHALENR